MYLTASQIVITMIGRGRRADWVCSHRLPNTMWYRCGGRESNLLPNLMSVWWWTGGRIDDEIGDATSCWICVD